MARGGKRKGAGRPKGSRSAATKQQQATISDMAREYSSDALTALVDVVRNGVSEAARVAAANSLLDRGYGKPVQSLEHSGKDGEPIEHRNVPSSEGELIEQAKRLGVDPSVLGLSGGA